MENVERMANASPGPREQHVGPSVRTINPRTRAATGQVNVMMVPRRRAQEISSVPTQPVAKLAVLKTAIVMANIFAPMANALIAV
jgi:hypothetical protein